MTIRLQVLDEPLLEFGRNEYGVDPRLTMRKSGALMALPDRIETHQLGLVCPVEEVQAIKAWFCANQRKRLPLVEIQSAAQAFGGRGLSDEYVNAMSLLQFECAVGHTWLASAGNRAPD
jgi:hypothetical protein